MEVWDTQMTASQSERVNFCSLFARMEATSEKPKRAAKRFHSAGSCVALLLAEKFIYNKGGV